MQHLAGRGNKIIALQRAVLSAPATRPTICVAFLKTNDPKLIEAALLDTDDRPICNIIKATLPTGLREEMIKKSTLDK